MKTHTDKHGREILCLDEYADRHEEISYAVSLCNQVRGTEPTFYIHLPAPPQKLKRVWRRFWRKPEVRNCCYTAIEFPQRLEYITHFAHMLASGKTLVAIPPDAIGKPWGDRYLECNDLIVRRALLREIIACLRGWGNGHLDDEIESIQRTAKRNLP